MPMKPNIKFVDPKELKGDIIRYDGENPVGEFCYRLSERIADILARHKAD